MLSVLVALMPKCGLCLAAYLNLFNVLGISIVKYYAWVLPVLSLLLLVSLTIGFRKARKMDDYRAFVFSALAVVLLLLSKTLFKSLVLGWIGICMLLISSVVQLWQSRHTCSTDLIRS